MASLAEKTVPYQSIKPFLSDKQRKKKSRHSNTWKFISSTSGSKRKVSGISSRQWGWVGFIHHAVLLDTPLFFLYFRRKFRRKEQGEERPKGINTQRVPHSSTTTDNTLNIVFLALFHYKHKILQLLPGAHAENAFFGQKPQTKPYRIICPATVVHANCAAILLVVRTNAFC